MIQWIQSILKRPNPVLQPEETSPWENFTFKIIHEVKYNRSPLTVYLANDKQPYASLILEMDPDKQILVLDEFFPQEGNKRVKSGETIQVSCRNNGISVKFECKVVKVINHNGLHGVLVRFPEDLDYMQRRETFRCAVPHQYPLMVNFIISNQPNMRATVEDISLTGMRLKVPHNITDHLLPRMQIDNCKIVKPNDEIIYCHLKVCHFDYKPEQHGTIMGCEFKMLPPNEQRQINKLVTDLQKKDLSDPDAGYPENFPKDY